MNAAINITSIPAELRAIPHWLHWVPGIRDGKETKLPRKAGGNYNADAQAPEMWSSFEDCIAKLNGDAQRGIGFTLMDADGLIFIDFDEVANPATGTIAICVQRIIKKLDSYTEFSPNDGVHIFVRGKLPAAGSKVGSCEMYAGKKFSTFTGNKIEGTPSTIEARNVDWLHRLMLAGTFNFEKNSKLAALMNGDISGYASQSEADLALCSLLAGLGLSAEDIDTAFRLSGLMRDKWDSSRGESTYGADTIARALRPKARPIQSNLSAGIELLRSENGSPRAVVENVLGMLRQSPAWASVLAFNEFTNRTVLRKPGPGFPADAQEFPREWTDRDTVLATGSIQRQGIMIHSMDAVGRAVQTVARENPFHPVRAFLYSLTWDGQPRIATWLSDYFGAPQTEYVSAVGSCWLVSAVARVMNPGVQADATILLQGIQGIGKSSALRTFAGDSWFCDHLSVLGTKDSRLELQGRWIVEISELSAIRRSEIETVKAYLTQRFDSFRAPYARTTETIARQNVFAATSNDEAPLTDSSGNRRFWPITCGKVRVQELAQARDQLWAEAYAAYVAKRPWWLTPEQEASLARPEQEERYETGCWDDLIARWLDRLGDAKAEVRRTREFEQSPLPWFGSGPDKVSISDLIIHAVGRDVPARGDEMMVARYLRHAGWKRKRETAGPFRKRYFYYRPEGGAE